MILWRHSIWVSRCLTNCHNKPITCETVWLRADLKGNLSGQTTSGSSLSFNFRQRWIYAKSLTLLIGSVNKRGGRDATTPIAGVPAETLRHLELLLAAPWKAETGLATG
jgi:hypothetical protein